MGKVWNKAHSKKKGGEVWQESRMYVKTWPSVMLGFRELILAENATALYNILVRKSSRT